MKYGEARSPQPTKAHTCAKRRQLHRGWDATSQDDCPACAVDRAEGWEQLLASVRAELFGANPHRLDRGDSADGGGSAHGPGTQRRDGQT